MAWIALGVVFGFFARRVSPPRLRFYAPIAVAGSLIAFKILLSVTGWVLAVDGP